MKFAIGRAASKDWLKALIEIDGKNCDMSAYKALYDDFISGKIDEQQFDERLIQIVQNRPAGTHLSAMNCGVDLSLSPAEAAKLFGAGHASDNK